MLPHPLCLVHLLAGKRESVRRSTSYGVKLSGSQGHDKLFPPFLARYLSSRETVDDEAVLSHQRGKVHLARATTRFRPVVVNTTVSTIQGRVEASSVVHVATYKAPR
jgi:hypothetical protein